MRTALVWSIAVAGGLVACQPRREPLRVHTTAAIDPPAATVVPPESPSLRSRMRGHDQHGVAMHEAIVRGDLGAAKREARVLAGLRVEGGIEPAWRRHLDAMNAAAEHVVQARDLHEAALAAGTVARTCGDCHASLGGPKPPVIGEPPSGQGSLASQMARHQWAAARLREGLVVPSDDAWRAGARALEDAPLSPSRLPPGKIPSTEIGDLAAAVHDLARKAVATDEGDVRGAIFGELTATCAACHEKLRAGK